jgi:hypothetical protein
MKRHGSRPLNYYLKPHLKETSSVFDFLELIKRWPEIVGTMVAENSTPVAIKFRRLQVATSHPLFSQELSFLTNHIIQKIHESFPELKSLFDSLIFLNKPDLVKTKQTSLPETQKGSSAQKSFHHKDQNPLTHPFSPHYKKLRQEAQNFFEEKSILFDDPEIKEIFISLYQQFSNSNNPNLS